MPEASPEVEVASVPAMKGQHPPGRSAVLRVYPGRHVGRLVVLVGGPGS